MLGLGPSPELQGQQACSAPVPTLTECPGGASGSSACRGAAGTGLTGCSSSPGVALSVTHGLTHRRLMKYMYSQSHSSQLSIRTSSLISNPSASWGFLSSCAQASCCAGRGGDATLLLCNCQLCLFACIYTDIYLEISSRQRK